MIITKSKIFFIIFFILSSQARSTSTCSQLFSFSKDKDLPNKALAKEIERVNFIIKANTIPKKPLLQLASFRDQLNKLAQKEIDALEISDIEKIQKLLERMERIIERLDPSEQQKASLTNENLSFSPPDSPENLKSNIEYFLKTRMGDSVRFMFSRSLVHDLRKASDYYKELLQNIHIGVVQSKNQQGIKPLVRHDKKFNSYNFYEIKGFHLATNNYRVYAVGVDNKFYFYKLINNHSYGHSYINSAISESLQANIEYVRVFLFETDHESLP